MKKRYWSILFVLVLALAGCAPGRQESTQTTVSTGKGHLALILEGEQTLTVEFGSEYQEPGARAEYRTSTGILPVEVSVQGSVDTGALGTYTLTYTAACDGATATVERKVQVVDTTAPVITLVSDPAHITLPGERYQEEGFTALDACDGDLTDKVQRQELEDKILYTVTDASGNTVTAERPIVYGDQTAPVLTLYGDTHITMTAGSAYPEPGYTANDNVDGDISHLVTVSGLDRYLAGTYTVTYSVTDSYGNTAQATRTVTVEAIRQPDVVRPGDKSIYLTFDDGPGPYTQKLLDVLAKYNVKATFFVVGAYGTAYMDLLPAMYQAGHSLGMHSVTHNYDTIYATEDAFFADLFAMQKVIYDYTGFTSTLMRFPGGSSNQVSDTSMIRLTQAVTDAGFQYFDWNVSSGDAGGTTDTQQVFQNVISGVTDMGVSIVLQHDIKSYSVDAVEKIIVWGLANGYTFLPLTPESPTAHHRPAY